MARRLSMAFLSSMPLWKKCIIGLAILIFIGFAYLREWQSLVAYIVIVVALCHFMRQDVIFSVACGIIVVMAFRSFLGTSREGLTGDGEHETELETDDPEKAADTSGREKLRQKYRRHADKTGQGLNMTPLDDTAGPEVEAQPDTAANENFEVGRSSNNIDYAATIEDAYSQLNDILGSDGIRQLTEDTRRLMKQQMQLAESMKSMGPLVQGMAPVMKQAQSLLEGMGGSEKLMQMMKTMGIGK